MRKTWWIVLLLAAAGLAGAAEKREVAITMDDLPVAQSGQRGCEFGSLQMQTLRLITAFLHERAPITAFVVGSGCPELTPQQQKVVLKLWLDAGAELGNHTFSHADLNTMDPAQYEQDILKCDEALRRVAGSAPRYFRYPMLHLGQTAETKARIAKFLASHGYTNAPVTFDNSDWMFSAVYADAASRANMEMMKRVRDEYVPYLESVVAFFEQRTTEVVGRDIPQILLLHANRLNADMAPEVLTMLKRRGYKFISLAEALKDPVYQQPESYVGPSGFSWIHRWSMTKGMPNKGEPDEPVWIADEYKKLRPE